MHTEATRNVAKHEGYAEEGGRESNLKLVRAVASEKNGIDAASPYQAKEAPLSYLTFDDHVLTLATTFLHCPTANLHKVGRYGRYISTTRYDLDSNLQELLPTRRCAYQP